MTDSVDPMLDKDLRVSCIYTVLTTARPVLNARIMALTTQGCKCSFIVYIIGPTAVTTAVI